MDQQHLGITWETVRNEGPQAPHQTDRIRNCMLAKCTRCKVLKSTVLESPMEFFQSVHFQEIESKISEKGVKEREAQRSAFFKN